MRDSQSGSRQTGGFMQRSLYAGVVLLSLGVAAYALVAYSLFPLGAAVHPDMQANFAAQKPTVYAHVFGSAVALAIGPFQFWSRLRTSRPRVHRTLGKIYLTVGVGVGGVAGLFMSVSAYGGMPSTLGFAGLALAWLYTANHAYGAARMRDFEAHRRWMIRNFALTFAAVTLRIYLPGSMAAGVPFEVAYPAIAWLCWVPNLIVAELLARNLASSRT
jgi:uncharacterized membrane protein